MKLTLRIEPHPSLNRPPFEISHAGPVVRIGRDESAEIILPQESAQGVSRLHAQIALAASGATLTDLGSSNGTLVNGSINKLAGAVSLNVGDRFQLGFTGPTITVVALDLAAAAPPASAAAPAARPAVAAWAVAAAATLVGFGSLAMLFLSGPPREPRATTLAALEPATVRPTAPVDLPPVKPPPDSSKVGKPPPAQPGTERDLPPPTNSIGEMHQNKPPPTPPPVPPQSEPTAVGRYAPQPVGVLLQRRSENYPWVPLQPDEPIMARHSLVCLPGFRSVIELDNKSGLVVLWGNLPEFSPPPTVLECVAMLESPSANLDLDLTLERGRVVISNQKAEGAFKARLQFLRERWEVILEKPGQEVALELWEAANPAGKLVNVLGMFVKGAVQVRQEGKTPQRFNDRSEVVWIEGEPAMGVQNVGQIPPWWAKPLDLKQPEIERTAVLLDAWAETLRGTRDDVLDAIRTQIQQSALADQRRLGMLFMAALDEGGPVVDCLFRDNPRTRADAINALQLWLPRRANHEQLVRQRLRQIPVAPAKIDLILRLLKLEAPSDRLTPGTRAELFGCLGHDDPLVRQLAFMRLARHQPQAAAESGYDPDGEPMQRQQAIAKWQARIGTN